MEVILLIYFKTLRGFSKTMFCINICVFVLKHRYSRNLVASDLKCFYRPSLEERVKKIFLKIKCYDMTKT